jgi:hypothetical protein
VSARVNVRSLLRNSWFSRTSYRKRFTVGFVTVADQSFVGMSNLMSMSAVLIGTS